MPDDVRSCPYCKEEIKADAIRCRYCHATIAPEKPPHGGVCPYCKEDIKADAIKCKHCGAMLVGDPGEKCAGCGGASHGGPQIPDRASGAGIRPLTAPVWDRAGPIAHRAIHGCTECYSRSGYSPHWEVYWVGSYRTCWTRFPKRFNPDGTIAEWSEEIRWEEECEKPRALLPNP